VRAVWALCNSSLDPSEGLPSEAGDKCACGLYGVLEKYKTNKFYVTVVSLLVNDGEGHAPVSPTSSYALVSAGHSM